MNDTNTSLDTDVLAEIERGTNEILPHGALIEKLKLNRPLIVKLGCDPTAADLHLGHTVVINKLRTLQNLGHEIHFLIGDFTAQIGDPTGKNITRPPMTALEVKQNAQTYTSQVLKILDPDKTVIRYNGDWFNKMSAADMIQLASCETVARMLERDDFSKRYTQNSPIAIHEFLYPLVQGHDSVVMKADIELGGTDQKFNLLMGRHLQKQAKQAQQVIITMPLLEGLEGVKKMSKSQDNYIGIAEAPEQMFGKIMSISDDLMWRYYALLSFKSKLEINQLQSQVKEGLNPRDVKMMLAHELIVRFHSHSAADQAQDAFINRFRKGQLPDNIPELTIVVDDAVLSVVSILKRAELVQSTSEAMRMIRQGAVKIDGQKISDIAMNMESPNTSIYQVGKRKFAKIILESNFA